MDFLSTLQTWFYRGASDMIHDEQGLDAFDEWMDQYATEPRTFEERESMRHMWGNGDSVALDVYETANGIHVQQGNEYAWLIPDTALDTMPEVAASRLIG